MQCSIDGRSRPREDTHYRERFVPMLDQADCADSMGQNNMVAQFVMQGLSDFGTKHYIVNILKWLAFAERERLVAPIVVMLEIDLAGTQHSIAAVGVAQ